MDEEMQQMVESVKRYGVLVPVLVRETSDGGYQMIGLLLLKSIKRYLNILIFHLLFIGIRVYLIQWIFYLLRTCII